MIRLLMPPRPWQVIAPAIWRKLGDAHFVVSKWIRGAPVIVS